MAENRHYRVSGRVQGVSYRASTQEKAKALGLDGWVRNCRDGSVELQASGDARALRQLEAWLWQGPAQARVAAVESRAADDEPVAGFEIRG